MKKIIISTIIYIKNNIYLLIGIGLLVGLLGEYSITLNDFPIVLMMIFFFSLHYYCKKSNKKL